MLFHFGKLLIYFSMVTLDLSSPVRNPTNIGIKQNIIRFEIRNLKMGTFKGVAAMWQTGVNLTYENNSLVYFFVLFIVS
jgi:hypothetical protein